ncbi:MAG: histidine ammonia-lyase [Acidimicrobiales bacterium]
MTERVIPIEPTGMRASDVLAVVRGQFEVEITPAAHRAMAASRAHVDAIAARADPVYGVSTGFGALATSQVPASRRGEAQISLLRSHAAGMGPRVEQEVVRATMLLRLRTLCSGITGVRPEVADVLGKLLNAHVTPLVYEFGSLGCSGDLAPLAHIALALIGEGDVEAADGSVVPAAAALSAIGVSPLVLQEKEGLGLINGTDGMLAGLALSAEDFRKLLKIADISAAMSTEALLATDVAFRPDLVGLRPQPGQRLSAENLTRLLAGSAIVASHRDDDSRVQDAYSIRCAPQVAGAARDTLAHVDAVVERELLAKIDNPVVIEDGEVVSNGNFHGAPLGYAADFLAIAAADLASIAERRTDRMMDRTRSAGLPPFLASEPGVDSGLMIAHYTQAAMVSELKRLAVPASVDSIPTSAMQEDHVSMGWAATRKLRTAVSLLRSVLAIEILAASRALALRAPLEPAAATGAVANIVLDAVGRAGKPDRYVAPQLAAAAELVHDRVLIDAAESAVGTLH